MENINDKRLGMLIPASTVTRWLACLFIIVSRVLIPLGLLPGVTLTVVLAGAVIANVMADGMRVEGTGFLGLELAFILLTGLSSMAVAKDRGIAMTAVQYLLYGLIYGQVMLRVSQRENGIGWFVRAWVVGAVIFALYMLLKGGYAAGKLVRITATENMNSNTLGVYMTVAIWSVLFILSEGVKTWQNKLPWILVGIALIAVFTYIIYGTGSRKSLLASLFLVGVWLIFELIPLFRRISVGKRVFIVLFSLAFVGVIILRFGSMFASISTTMLYRMDRLVNSSESLTDMHRFDLIRDAFGVFLKHPVIGVGWNNYRYYSFSLQYSHCTYVEILACTGLVGSVMGYGLWFILLRRVLQFLRTRSDRIIKVNILSLLGALLFLNAVQIMYYNVALLMIQHIIYTMTFTDHGKDEVDELMEIVEE